MDPVTIQDVFAVIEKADTNVSLPHSTWVLIYKFVGAALAEGRAQSAPIPSTVVKVTG